MHMPLHQYKASNFSGKALIDDTAIILTISSDGKYCSLEALAKLISLVIEKAEANARTI